MADTLQQRRAEAVALIGEEQWRVWLLYLAGGLLAFEENRMGVHQILMVRPDDLGRSGCRAGARRRWAAIHSWITIRPRDGPARAVPVQPTR